MKKILSTILLIQILSAPSFAGNRVDSAMPALLGFVWAFMGPVKYVDLRDYIGDNLAYQTPGGGKRGRSGGGTGAGAGGGSSASGGAGGAGGGSSASGGGSSAGGGAGGAGGDDGDRQPPKRGGSAAPKEGYPKATGSWSEEEDNALRQAVRKLGTKSWVAIAKKVAKSTGTRRNHRQCWNRWDGTLKPGIVRGLWTAAEDKKLLDYMLSAKTSATWEGAQNATGRPSKRCYERWRCHLNPDINKAPVE